MKTLLSAILLAGTVSTAYASEPVDCPLRDNIYSLESPIIDVMISAEALSVVDQVSPSLMSKLPRSMFNTDAPTMGAIMSMRNLARMVHMNNDQAEALGAALAKVKVTEHVRNLRCARYDTTSIELEGTAAPVSVLLFEKVNGYKHDGAIIAFHKAIEDIVSKNKWSLAVTDKGGAITAETLEKVDVVIWNNISGDALTLTQREVFRDWVEAGGGFFGVHGSGGDSTYWWDWYADELIGARFTGHPMAPQLQETTVLIEQTENKIGNDLQAKWALTDEWYSFSESPRGKGATIIATIDESGYSPIGMGGQPLAMGEDHPIVWTRCVENGRSFYSAIGHQPEIYSDSTYRSLLENGLIWTAGIGATTCANGKETRR